MTIEIQIRACHTLAEYDECVELQHLVWGEDIVVPSAIFVVAHHTGGLTLGAFIDAEKTDDGERMVGFSLALAGIRGSAGSDGQRPCSGERFLHSHMTAVLPEYQNAGVGRRLKLRQREEALERGIQLIEWTFDPLELKNAHFNFVRLGAIARRFIPNCYGITESPLHAGLPTDRLIAEWWLDSPRVCGILGGKALPDNLAAQSASSPVCISLPADIVELKSKDPAAGARIQSEVRAQFQGYFERGYVATSIENSGTSTDYILEQRDSVAGLRLPKSPAE
ncbi:MAG: acetyltransferase [Candidatus Acidiferrales bacterium]